MLRGWGGLAATSTAATASGRQHLDGGGSTVLGNPRGSTGRFLSRGRLSCSFRGHSDSIEEDVCEEVLKLLEGPDNVKVRS